MPQSIQQVIAARILLVIVHLVLVQVVLQLILIATPIKKRRRQIRRRKIKRRIRRRLMALQHLVQRAVVVQKDQVVTRIRRRSHLPAVVSPAKVHLHQVLDQSQALRRIRKEVTKEAQVLVRAQAPTTVRITLKSRERNLRRSTPRLKPSSVTIGAWPRSMLRTAPRPI